MRIYFRTQSQADKYFAAWKAALPRLFHFGDPAGAGSEDSSKRLPWQKVRNAVSQGMGYASYEELTYIHSKPHPDWNHNQYDLYQSARESFSKVHALAQLGGFTLDRKLSGGGLGYPDYPAWWVARDFYLQQGAQLASRHFGATAEHITPDPLWPLEADTWTIFPALWAAWSATPYLTVVKRMSDNDASLAVRQPILSNFYKAFFYWGEALRRMMKVEVPEDEDLVKPGHPLHRFGVHFSAAIEIARGLDDEPRRISRKIAAGIHRPIELPWCEYGFQLIYRAVTSAVPETYALWETTDSALCDSCLARYRSKTATTKKELSAVTQEHGWTFEKADLEERPKVPATPSGHYYTCPQCAHYPLFDLYFREPSPDRQAERKRNFEKEVGRIENPLPEAFFSGGYRFPPLKPAA